MNITFKLHIYSLANVNSLIYYVENEKDLEALQCFPALTLLITTIK